MDLPPRPDAHEAPRADRPPASGREAADAGLINEAVPFERLEAPVAALAAELAGIPSSQLAAMKLIVNQAYENMGLASTQTEGRRPDPRNVIEP